jgi:ATP-dependent exoDNAse (exonuclease V) alpha subunit
MNNPMPRKSNFLDRFKSSIKTHEQLAAEIDTGLSVIEEQKVNKLVGQLLREMPEDIKESMGVSEYDESAPVTTDAVIDVDLRRAPATTGFQLPTREEAGLSNPNIVLDESQQEAVARLASEQYGCLIGAAGTGKTTVLKYVLDRIIYEDHSFDVRMLSGNQGLNIAMVSFTGMAVQVMKSNLPEWMHPSCKTIHSLLEFAPEQVELESGKSSRRFVPQRNNLRKLDHDIIMIDEASMVGVELWVQLLAACRFGTRIYMIGDLNQLPPIVGQSVFGFALGQWHVCELTKVHRQKDPGANRIVEVAHEVLNGRPLTFDQAKDNPDWRVIFSTLKDDPVQAHNQILAILNQLRSRRVNPADPDSPIIYDPYRDRVMTAGNGYEPVNTSAIHQHPINESLSTIIEPPTEENPRILIDGGREQTKRFAVNLRVMATKNEAPDMVSRVTNGMTGVITGIKRNGNYTGRWDHFGTEAEVKAATAAKLAQLRSGSNQQEALQEVADFNFDDMVGEEGLSSGQTQEELDGGGASSHIVDVRFDNGAERTFSSKAGVGSLQLAYASTVAKCQGSQFDTAIIICHPAAKAMLSREWLYTAITRASQRVIILGTDYAVRQAVAKQKIRGATLAEKVNRYLQMATEGERVGQVRVRMNVPLRVEDYNGQSVKTKYEYDLE